MSLYVNSALPWRLAAELVIHRLGSQHILEVNVEGHLESERPSETALSFQCWSGLEEDGSSKQKAPRRLLDNVLSDHVMIVVY